ncbi:MAG TPA: hypothetical protein EYG92_02650, partial [Lutibacter sp.]|nr:hypothetical protein [Lutibacter sp.]
MKNKNKVLGLIGLAVVIVATAFFALTTKAENIENITINALIFNNEGQLVPDGTYEVRFSLYTTDRVKEDSYPSNKDKNERVWESEKRIELKDGKLKTSLSIQNLKYNKYYLGIRINEDREMTPRKEVVLGSISDSKQPVVKEYSSFTKNLKTKIIDENFTSQETLNQTLIEAINQFQTGTNPGDIPVLNSDGKINRALLDIPTPAGSGGVSSIALDMAVANISNEDITNIINNLANNETFINNTIHSFTSNVQEDGDTVIYDNNTNRYISTPFELGSLNNVDISSVDDKDILIYDEDNNEWINKPIADYSTVYTAGTGININSNQISLIDTTDDDSLGALSCANNEIAKWNSGTSQWICAIDAGGVGSTTFAALTDTPANYVGSANYLTRVNALATGLEFFDGSIYLDNTDNQNLTSATLNGATNELTINIEDGTGVTVDLTNLINDADFDITNEIQDLNLLGNNLTITNNAGATTIDLSPYLDNTDTLASLGCNPSEIASWNGANWVCVVNNGGTDDQQIDTFTLVANVLTLEMENDGQPAQTVNLSAYLDNTDEQDLTLTGNTLAISNDPNTNVDLSGFLD